MNLVCPKIVHLEIIGIRRVCPEGVAELIDPNKDTNNGDECCKNAEDDGKIVGEDLWINGRYRCHIERLKFDQVILRE